MIKNEDEIRGLIADAEAKMEGGAPNLTIFPCLESYNRFRLCFGLDEVESVQSLDEEDIS